LSVFRFDPSWQNQGTATIIRRHRHRAVRLNDIDLRRQNQLAHAGIGGTSPQENHSAASRVDDAGAGHGLGHHQS
jgi:hypothetical protein